MRIINPNASFTWDAPLDIMGVPMMGVPEKQGTSFSRHGWLRWRTGMEDASADQLGLLERAARRPLSSHYLQIARHDYAARRVVPFPRYFIIEPTNICNRACPFCSIDVVNRPHLRTGVPIKGHMRWMHFETLMRECAQHDVYGLSLYQLGDAMLWKDLDGQRTIADMVSVAKQLGGFRVVNVSTNGDVNNLHLLLDCPLDDLIISIDGTTAEVYDENRPSTRSGDTGAFARTLSRVEAFLREKVSRSKVAPYVRMQIINKDNTRRQVLDFIRHWIQVPGVDDVFVKHLDGMEPWIGDRAADDAAGSARKMTDVSSMPCQHLWAIGSMTVAGTFNGCCHDARTELTEPGANVSESTFAEWWRGDYMTNLRAQHLAGTPGLPCATCRERDPWLGQVAP